MTQVDKTIIYFLDAVREDYIDEKNTPFLWKLKHEQTFMNLIPLLGYSSGIHPTIWSGTYQQDHGNFLIYGYDPENSPFKWMRVLRFFPEKLKQYIIGATKAPYYMLPKLKRFFPKWYFKKILPVPASIDPRVAGYFKVMNDPFEKPFFDIMKQNDISMTSTPQGSGKNYGDGTPHKNWKLSDAIVDFYFHGDTDGLGHYPGPHSAPLTKLMNELDIKLKELYDDAIKKYGKVNLFVFSDHGMEEIKHTVDVKTVLEGLGLKLEKDYVVFYDSTFVRIWINNESVRQKIIDGLSSIDHLTYLDETLKEKYKINFKSRKWGDLFFIADNGYRIFPDNFSPLKFNTKGMHGYFPEDNKEAQGIFITNTFHSSQKEIDVVDLFSTMLYHMGYEKLIPSDTIGKPVK